MLKANKKVKKATVGGRYAIVASQYNDRYVGSMLRAAVNVLKQGGAEEVRVIRVPGAVEIPVVVSRLGDQAPSYSAIICLGVIIRGATTHAQTINDMVTSSLATLTLKYEIPIVHEVLLLENEQQAKERCLDKNRNRGTEAAQTALAMAKVMRTL